MPSNRCTNCITSHSECTHTVRVCPFSSCYLNCIELTVIQTVQSPSAPAQSRKTAQELVAMIISPSPVYVPLNDSDTSHKILVEVATYARSLEEKLAALQPQTLVPVDNASSLRTSESGALVDKDEPFPIQDALRGLILTDFKSDAERFYGRSSSVQFIKSAMKHIHGNTSYVAGVQRPEFWSTQSVSRNSPFFCMC
jgi:hypothetical protein